MSLSDRYKATVTATGRAEKEISCPHYQPKPDSRRCQNYLDNGACAREDEFMCIQWLKANNRPIPDNHPAAETQAIHPTGTAVSSTAAVPASSSVPPQKDLLGYPVSTPKDTDSKRHPKTEKGSKRSVREIAGNTENIRKQTADRNSRTAGVTFNNGQTTTAPTAPMSMCRDCRSFEELNQKDIKMLDALGIEVCLHSDKTGDIWIVPEYTDQNRKEISIEHAAKLRLVISAFPGLKVTAFEKLSKTRSSHEEV